MQKLRVSVPAVTVERSSDGRVWVVECGRFRALLPVCGCEREVCAGPCKPDPGRTATGHRRARCHGDTVDGRHIEHVQVFATKVAASFNARGRRAPVVPTFMSPAKVAESLGLTLAQYRAELAKARE